jgi:hypothetical protein
MRLQVLILALAVVVPRGFPSRHTSSWQHRRPNPNPTRLV